MSIVKRHISAKPCLTYGETLSLSYSSMIIDGIFISDLILETRDFYSEIYPDKDLPIPSIYAVINRLLEWSNFPQDRQVRCHLILPHENIHGVPGILDPEKIKADSGLYDEEIDPIYVRKRDCNCIVSWQETRDFVWSEVEMLVNRLTNVENVLLVANDPAYRWLFEKMEEQEIEIVWANYPNGWRGGRERCFYPWHYIDMVYPIACSMGLTRHEL